MYPVALQFGARRVEGVLFGGVTERPNVPVLKTAIGGVAEALENTRNTALGLGNADVWSLPVVTRFYPELPAYSSTGSTTIFRPPTAAPAVNQLATFLLHGLQTSRFPKFDQQRRQPSAPVQGRESFRYKPVVFWRSGG